MKSSTKTTLIIIGIILAAFVLFVAMFASANNKAIFLEEQVKGALSNIEVAEKRRVDLVYNLVDATLAYQEYEGDTKIDAHVKKYVESCEDKNAARKQMGDTVKQFVRTDKNVPTADYNQLRDLDTASKLLQKLEADFSIAA